MKLFRSRGTPVSRRSARVWMLRFRKFGIIAAVTCLVFGAGYYGWKHGSFARAGVWVNAETLSVTSASGFKVREVLVTGRDHIARDTLLAHLAVHQGEPIFGISIDAARKSVAEISWVKDVSITRRLPDAILVDVTERAPAALWQYQKKVSLIDIDGRTLDADSLDAWQNLPLVVGEDAPQHVAQLLTLLQAEPGIAAQMSSATRIGGRRWDLHLKNGVLVKLPENDVELALSKLAKEQRDDKIFGKAVIAIDLRLPDETVIEPAPGVLPEEKDKKTI